MRSPQVRAREPDETGFAEGEGVRLAYEVFGTGDTTVLLMPTWSIIDSRFWKAQVPFLSRHFRVVTFDGRGSGRSDRPRGAGGGRQKKRKTQKKAVFF
ncbi:MAG: alpha/beta fold hydrolase, partial [Nocardioidaceae bacterium]